MKNKKFIYAVGTLSGTIIGVGLFALPYIAVHSGIWLVIGYFLGLGVLAVVMHLLFCEVSLKTPDFLRAPGFARYHLGNWAGRVSFTSFIIGMFGVLLVYLIIGGKFLSNLLSPFLNGSDFTYTLIYFIVGSLIIFFGIGLVSLIELLGLVLFFAILIVIFIKGLPQFELLNIHSPIQRENIFLPYGPILFSLWGIALIPEIEEMLKGRKYLLKKVIPIAILIPIIAYLSFIFLVTGISGLETSTESIEGLKGFLDNKIIMLASAFGLLTTFTSFIILGLTLKKVFWYDLKLDKNLAWFIACFVPLALFLVGFNFINVISFVGAVMLGIDGTLILLMYQKIKGRKVSLITLPLATIFILGIVYEIIYFLK